MAAGDNPLTLAELQDDAQETYKEVTGNSTLDTIWARELNKALHDIAAERWPWWERTARILTHDDYTTGTVALALSARTTLTGTDTLWNTTVTGMGFTNARAGGKIVITGEDTPYAVSSVGSDTAITLADTYIGATALTASTYRYFEDEYALAADFGGIIDARFFDDAHTIHLVGPQEFRLRFPRNIRVGRPTHATIIELGPSAAAAALRPRVVFGPPPDAQYAIPYTYQTTYLATSSTGTKAANLSASTDEPTMPARWRRLIVWKALSTWAGGRGGDPAAKQQFDQEYTTLSLRARATLGEPANDRPRIQPKAHYWTNRWARGAYRTRRGSSYYSDDDLFDQVMD